jgi:putative endonuclease
MKRGMGQATRATRRVARGHQARRLGVWAEWACAASLILRGWRILDRRVVAGRGSGAGEIDIVARRGNLVAFIEVKARPTLAEATEAISTLQRERLTRAASAYVARRPALAHCDLRFDAMLVAPWRAPRHLSDAWRDAG